MPHHVTHRGNRRLQTFFHDIETKTSNPVMAAGQTRQVSITWTTTKGSHSLTVTADSAGAVDESFEENNSLTQSLPEVIDTTPPALEIITPADGAILQDLSTITFTLNDAHGQIDDATVIASINFTNEGGQTISGAAVESNDTFTFTPAQLPLSDGSYSFAFNAVDDSENSAHFSIASIIDGLVPEAPVVTGGQVLSGVISIRPTENKANTSAVTYQMIAQHPAPSFPFRHLVIFRISIHIYTLSRLTAVFPVMRYFRWGIPQIQKTLRSCFVMKF
jgi:hypothetical protein